MSVFKLKPSIFRSLTFSIPRHLLRSLWSLVSFFACKIMEKSFVSLSLQSLSFWPIKTKDKKLIERTLSKESTISSNPPCLVSYGTTNEDNVTAHCRQGPQGVIHNYVGTGYICTYQNTSLSYHYFWMNSPVFIDFQELIREPFKNYLTGFFPLRGGVPPLSAKFFWAQWLSVKGGGCTPLSVKEKIR